MITVKGVAGICAPGCKEVSFIFVLACAAHALLIASARLAWSRHLEKVRWILRWSHCTVWLHTTTGTTHSLISLRFLVNDDYENHERDYLHFCMEAPFTLQTMNKNTLVSHQGICVPTD